MAMQKKLLLTIAPLFLVLIIDTMGVGLIVPIIGPLFMQQAHGILPTGTSIFWRDFLYGLTLAGFSILMFFGAPFLGDLSDYLGRKKVLIICLIVTAISYVISGLGIIVHSVTWLIVGRCLAGFMAGSQPIAQAAIADVSSKESKALNVSLIIFAACLGFVMGPIIGGYFANSALVPWFNFSTPFFVAGLLALFNAICLIFTFQETYYPKPEKKLRLIKGMLVFFDAFTQVKIRGLAMAMLLMQTGWAIYFIFVSLFMVQIYHYGATQVGHLMAYFGLIWSITFIWIVRVSLKFMSLEKMAVICLIIAGLGLLCPLIPFEIVIWLSAIPIGVANGLLYTALVTLLSNLVDQDSQGWIMGVSSAVVAAAWSLGGVLSGMLGSVSPYFPFVVASLLTFSALLVFVYALKTRVST